MVTKPNESFESEGRRLLESYKRHMTGVISPQTVKLYAGEDEKYLSTIDWDIRNINLATASEFLTMVFAERMLEGNKNNEVKTVSISTRNVRVAALNSFAEWLYKTMGVLQNNPLEDLKRGKIPQRLPKFLTDDEMKQLLAGQDTASHEGMRDRALLEFLYCTGCRVSEAANLTWDNVDMKHASVQIIGKGDKERMVYMSDECIAWMQKYHDYSWKYWQRHATTHDEGMDNVFTNANFMPVSRNIIFNWITAAGRRAKLKKHVHPHLLRHTFGTTMIRNGANIIAVKEVMGHTSVATTQIYTSVTEQDKQDAVRTVFNRKAQ